MAQNPVTLPPPAVKSVRPRPRVVVVGGGFAGLNAGMALSKMAVDVTLIDRRNHHTFQPLLYQVALAVLSPADIAQPIRSIFSRNKNIEVLMDEVVAIEPANHRVLLHSGAQVEYDYLILATGSTHSYFGKDDWAPLAPGLKTIEDATEIRRRVLLAFELAEREMVETGAHPELNFVIIGGGPTGVEVAGAISDISKLYMRHDFRHIDPSKARVILLEGSPRILAAYPEDLSKKAVEQLAQLGVEVHAGQSVMDVKPGYVMVGGKRLDAVVTIWAAGVQASPLGKMLGTPTDKRGCTHRRPLPESAQLSRHFRLRRSGPRRRKRPPSPWCSPAGHADGQARRPDDCAGHGTQAAHSLPLFRQRRHGHHRPSRSRRQRALAPQSPLVRNVSLALLGKRPPLLPGGLPKPPGRLLLLGLDLPDLQPRSPPHHRQPPPARLGPTSRHPSPGNASPYGHHLTPLGAVQVEQPKAAVK